MLTRITTSLPVMNQVVETPIEVVHTHDTPAAAAPKASLGDTLGYVGKVIQRNAAGVAKDAFQSLLDATRARFGLAPHRPPVTIDVDPARLEKDVRLFAGNFSPRDFAHRDNLDLLAAHLGRELAAAGGRVSEQPFQLDAKPALARYGKSLSDEEKAALAEADGKTYKNVIASFGPEDGDRVVVGAHYDACGPFPGADDNATGIAGLLELARHFQEHPPQKRVDLVAYTLEEPPTFRTEDMGSAVHARSLKEAGVNAQMMSLEMLGYYSDEKGSQAYPAIPIVNPLLKKVFGDRGDYLGIITRSGQQRSVRNIGNAIHDASSMRTIHFAAPPELPGVDFSDHLNYWNEQIPAVMVTDTAFLRNQAYHTAEDTPDRLDYARMAEGVKGIFNAVHQMAS